MSSFIFNWGTVNASLGVTKIDVLRVLETTPEATAAAKLDIANAVIGSVGPTANSFTDDTAIVDHSAYHYRAVAYRGDQIVMMSKWKRVWRRLAWGPGPTTIMHGDENNGYMGKFAGDISSFMVFDAADITYTEHQFFKFIVDKRVLFLPCMSYSAIGNTIATNALVNAWLTRIRAAISNNPGVGVRDMEGVTVSHTNVIPRYVIEQLFGENGPTYPRETDNYCAAEYMLRNTTPTAQACVHLSETSGSQVYSYTNSAANISLTNKGAYTSWPGSGTIEHHRLAGVWMEPPRV